MLARLSMSTCAFALLFAGPGFAGDRFVFREAGFSIAPLEEAPGAVPYQALVMFLPPSAQFSSNVNVQVQPFAGTRQEYLDITRQQLAAAGLTELAARLDGAADLVVEYTGELQGRELHWYGRASFAKGRVYLATGTGLQAAWQSVGPKLRASVDSIRLEVSP